MAKLVAALCPKCGANVSLDPSSEFVTCTYCGTSSFIETKQRPVTQQIAQAHYPVIHVKAPNLALIVGPIVLVTMLAIGGSLAAVFFNMRQSVSKISAFTFSPGTHSKSSSTSNVTSGSSPAEAAAKDNFFADSSSLYPNFSKSIGTPLNIKQLVIYPEYAILTAQDPKNTAHVDRYTYRNGDVSEPDAIRMSGSSKTELDKALFDLGTVDFGKLPSMIADALKAIPVEDAKASHVILDRMLPFYKDVLFRVYVSGPRDSGGYVTYTLPGQRKKVMK